MFVNGWRIKKARFHSVAQKITSLSRRFFHLTHTNVPEVPFLVSKSNDGEGYAIASGSYCHLSFLRFYSSSTRLFMYLHPFPHLFSKLPSTECFSVLLDISLAQHSFSIKKFEISALLSQASSQFFLRSSSLLPLLVLSLSYSRLLFAF